MQKKVYEKPSIYMERFELAQHIANCAFELNQEENACGFIGEVGSDLYGVVLFNEDLSICDYPSYEFSCGFNGQDGMNTFDS